MLSRSFPVSIGTFAFMAFAMVLACRTTAFCAASLTWPGIAARRRFNLPMPPSFAIVFRLLDMAEGVPAILVDDLLHAEGDWLGGDAHQGSLPVLGPVSRKLQHSHLQVGRRTVRQFIGVSQLEPKQALHMCRSGREKARQIGVSVRQVRRVLSK